MALAWQHWDHPMVRLIRKAGNEFSWPFPSIAAAIVPSAIRGKAVVCDGSGLADFELIRRERVGRRTDESEESRRADAEAGGRDRSACI
jgi:hypothetical protein